MSPSSCPVAPRRRLPVPRRLRRALRTWLLALGIMLPAAAAVAGEPTQGTLVVVGGGSENVELLADVLELARGRASQVAIINTASERPAQSGLSYRRFFQEMLGVVGTTVVPLLTREQAYDEAVLQQIGRADLIYFTGGNQIRLAQALAGTPAHGALLAAWQRGVVLAGTSAGAMVWGPSYITTGVSAQAVLRGDGPGSVETRAGLGVVPGFVVDTHFGREGRLGRLLVAAAGQPRGVGLGVDEGTAAVVRPDGVRVLGAGRVTVLDLAGATPGERAGGPLSLRNVEMHLLAAGEGLRWRRDPAERRPMLAERAKEALSSGSLWMQGGAAVPPAAWFAQAAGPFAPSAGVFRRMPDEVVVLVGDDAQGVAQQWQAAIAANGRTTVRLIAAEQVRTPLFAQYLAIAGGVVLLEDGRGSLAAKLAGEPAQLLRQQAGHLQFVSVGAAAGLVGEAVTGANAELAAGVRVAPGLALQPNIWSTGAVERLALEALMADGALGVGLSPDNGVSLEGGFLTARGESPVLLVETRQVSLANPPAGSARDLRLHVLAPGERLRFPALMP
ncbi:MAG: cyanophycinase [Candidatus Sericytochromatia bacterium]|nr:cyanophycinase [Candidatus Sericytochromatia bacterium]